jgi:hypothetical protein
VAVDDISSTKEPGKFAVSPGDKPCAIVMISELSVLGGVGCAPAIDNTVGIVAIESP